MVNELSGVRACCILMLSDEAMSLDDFGQAVVLPPCQQQQCNVTSTSCLPITRTPATSSLIITPVKATAPLSTSTSLLSPSESSNLSITRTAAAALLGITPDTSTAALTTSTSLVSCSESSNTSRCMCYPFAINPIVSGSPSEQHNEPTKNEQSLIQPSIHGQVLNQASIHTIPSKKQSREHKPFWRGFEDTPSLPDDTEATVQSPDDTLKTENTADILKTEDTAELVCDSDANMALLNNKKLCKLDAICAKLINKGPTNDVGTIGQTADDHDNDSDLPEDLSSKCLNNNIIGKVDLHNVGKAQDNATVITNGSHSIKHSTSDEHTVTSEDIHKDTNNVLDATHNNILSKKSPKLFPHEQFGYNNAIGSSRRKSRKASTPRNIAQVRDIIENIDEKDELAEYEINNLNTNFPPEENDVQDIEKDNKDRETRTSTASSYNIPNNGDIEDDTSEHSLTLNHSKSSSLNHSTSSKKSNISSDMSDVFDEAAPLDLSVSNKSIKPDNDESIHNDGDVSDDEEYLEDDRHLIIDEQTDKISISRSSSPVNVRRDSGGEQAAHLKDYAESTMNELISMYGFGGQNPTDLSRHASLANFRHMIPASLRPIPADVPILPTKKPKLSLDSESDDGSQHEKTMMPHFGMPPHNHAGNQIKPEVGIKLQNDRFTTSSSFINAVFNANSGAAKDPLLAPKTLLPNYSKYLKRYNNGNECGNQHCKDLLYKEHYHCIDCSFQVFIKKEERYNNGNECGNQHCKDLLYKEHYHCIDCSFQVFIKKEEMVRHYKWHKKREESLQHGFLRFSPLDNCSKRFGPCTHNRKQTHYHCLQKGCDKVYISTSDVQMHANYHRKDSAIMSEGFQRFRATEDCGTLACAFYGQRTTHFHCLRPDCKFTFKNKADMEKHKSYHQKDEVLGRDGFKKFMKYEHCNFPGCRYSKLSNHIHCIRSGCDYVLHSTAQLYSHKRKHERRDFEAAYKHFRTNQPPLVVPQPNKGIIPRNDFGSASQAQSIALKPVVQAVPTSVIQTMAGMKRPASNSQHEALELKKPKLEPMMESNSDIDISAPPSPGTSTGRSSPGDQMMERNNSNYSMDDNMSDFSDSGHHDDDKQHGNSSFDEDSLDLSSSLSLKIPLLSNKDEPGTSPDSKSPSMQPSASNTSLPVTFSSINSTMLGTLPGSLLPMMNQGTMMTVPSTLTGVSTALQPPKSVYNERREKDDSWKNYLVRYTANDPCNPRCQYLYKDHYHCKIDGCLVLFKSKDGVREHARFHELQDRITPIAYKEYSETEACPDACQYSEKERHYHCIWTDCTHVVPYIGPTFGRLEHYRIHEYARAAAGKAYGRSNRNVGNIDDSHMRRRGRPPKYPKIELPKIPKVELSDEEIRQSQAPLKDSEAALPADTKVFNGFRIFHRDDPCPDDQCSFIGRLHYHCARPRCFTITDRLDVLNLHAKDFHSFVNILEGYEFFDRNVSCRRMNCINNQTNRHFHCTRPKCDYSFIRHSTMAQHEKKHNGAESGPMLCTPDDKKDKAVVRRDAPIPILPATKPTNSQPIPVNTVQPLTTVIKTEPGTLIPVPSLNQNLMPNLPLLISPTQGGPLIIPQAAGIPSVTLPGSSTGVVTAVPLAIPISTIQALPPSVTSSHLVSGIPNTNIPHTQTDGQTSAVNTNTTAPLTVLLQRGINQIPQPSWNKIKAKMHYGLSQNCGRPFCKLKKKDHYHCYDCNQAFSDPARLRSHIGKHGIKFKRSDSSTQPLALVPGSSGLKTPNINTGDEIENGDMDPDEAKCLADNGNMSDSENEEDKNSSSLNLNPSTFSEMISKAQEQNKLTDFPEMSFPSMDSSKAVDYSKPVKLTDIDNSSCDSELNLTLPNFSVQNIMKTKQDGFINSNNISLSNPGLVGGLVGGIKNNYVLKQPFKIEPPNHLKIEPPNHMKIDPPNHKSVVPGAMRAMKDESVPPGYSRWKYNQECSYPKCAYRHSVTHFHCNRSDCGYGFSDRSRLVQHSLRHERIDSITGGELQQYRINQDCEKPNCEFNRKMSHFHCKRCEYSCTDSSKVLTHRKHHAKLDSIANQGFKKFGATEGCGVRLCAYEKRQTHFHCLVESCKAAVLGLPQMNSHKLKHVGSLH